MKETMQMEDGQILDLNIIWPFLNPKQTNLQFWKHEYHKHGKNFMGSQEEYSRITVEMFHHLYFDQKAVKNWNCKRGRVITLNILLLG